MTTLIENTPAAWSERALHAATSAEAAMWSEGGQTRRFLAALRLLSLRADDTLLDYGCGTGRFCEFLPPDVLYYGHDTSPQMLERMTDEHPRATPMEALVDGVYFDHVVAIGCFNLADNWSKEQTFKALWNLWTFNTRRSLLVSLYRGTDPSCIRYEPEDAAEFARRLAATFFVIDCVYAENDLTLAVYR